MGEQYSLMKVRYEESKNRHNVANFEMLIWLFSWGTNQAAVHFGKMYFPKTFWDSLWYPTKQSNSWTGYKNTNNKNIDSTYIWQRTSIQNFYRTPIINNKKTTQQKIMGKNFEQVLHKRPISRYSIRNTQM